MTLQQKRWSGCLLWIASLLLSIPSFAATWYVRPDGGTRYSVNKPEGQCNGTADAAYPGSGTNKNCAFNDVRYLWQDTSYTTGGAFPGWGWIGKGGDTYIIRGSIADHVSYRIGYDSGSYVRGFGVAGDPYGSGMPPPLSGTATQHTRILGGNYANCRAQNARTQLHGGYATSNVVNMSGASYVDLQCFDITDFSSCGRSGQVHSCSHDAPVDDYAVIGLAWNNKSTHDVVSDIRIHGLSFSGMGGSTGDGVEMHRIDILGNAGAGWNADANDNTTGTGHTLIQNYNISWNGCAEEYPIVHPLPYTDCTDQNSGGYGDGFGTATVDSQPPGWQVAFDQGEAAYNTQDGLDALHLRGSNSSMTITHTLAYGNMGQQIKIGGSAGTATNNVIYASCNALRKSIPGTPEGYNKNLSLFCRAGDSGVVLTVADNATTVFSDNILYSPAATAIEVEPGGPCKTSTCLVRQQRNIFIGFRNNAANGYPGDTTGDYSNPLYVDDAAVPAYKNAGSSFDHNVTFHAKSTWRCPDNTLHEKNATCADPHLKDESWHVYGYGDTSRTQPIPEGSAQSSTSSPDADTFDPDVAKRHRHVLPAMLGVSIGIGVVAGAMQLRKRRANS